MTDWDIVIVGRSYAALSAALTLGRLRKSTLVIGDGPPRNEAAAHTHGLLSRDHTSATELIARSEDDLDRYDTVLLERGHIESITESAGVFTLTFGDRTTSAETVILATGVNDDIPALPGLADLWGNGVYTCPFCDGYEHADQPWALVGDDIEPMHVANLCNWASTVTLLHPDPNGELAESFATLPLPAVVDSRPARRARRSGEQLTVDFASTTFGAIFVAPCDQPNNKLAQQLGCDLDANGYVVVDRMGATTIPGVFAIGDLTRRGPHQITFSAADGMMTAMAIAFRAAQALLAGEEPADTQLRHGEAGS